MTTQLQLVRFLNSYLRIREIKDFSRNGLQADGKSNRKKDIKKIALAVDASSKAVGLAKRKGCDFLIVHHGILWKGQRDDFGSRKKVIASCKRLGVSLYASHLPLDLHPTVGNNIMLAETLGLKNIRKFGSYHKKKIGFKGDIYPVSIKEIESKLNKALKTRSIVLQNSNRKIRSIGIVSGGGSDSLKDAYREKLDLLITGEAPHYISISAEEAGLNVMISGHYHTETLGVKALGKLIEEKFNIPSQFLDIPTKV